MVNLLDLKKLRNETQVSLADCRKALEESNGDYNKALDWLKEHGIEKSGIGSAVGRASRRGGCAPPLGKTGEGIGERQVLSNQVQGGSRIPEPNFDRRKRDP